MPRKFFPFYALFAMLLAVPCDAQADAPAEQATPAQAPGDIVGRWMGLSIDGEKLDEGDFVLVFNADGSGAIHEGDDAPEDYTYTYDPDTRQCSIHFEGDPGDPLVITFTLQGDTATFAPPNNHEVIVARRVSPDGAIPPPPAPVDTSDSPLLGRWMLVQINGEPVPDGLVLYDHRADGTGRVIEDGEPADAFGWDHDLAEAVVTFETPDPITLTFHVVLYEDLAVYFTPDVGGMRLVFRRVPDAGDEDDAGAQTPADAPMVGQWAGVSNNGEPVDADDSVRLVFKADGSGDLYEDGDEPEPFAWSYDATAEVCTITVDGERIKFLVAFDGDTMTFESEDAEKFLVMRRIVEEGAGDAPDASGSE